MVKASFADFERADVVEASYENFENFKRNCVCCGLFFKFSYILLNTDYCCGWLNHLETIFTFWRSRLTCFDSRSRSWSIEHSVYGKHGEVFCRRCPIYLKAQKAKWFFGILIQFGHLVVQFQNAHAGFTIFSVHFQHILKALQVHSGPHFLTCGYY